MLQGQSIKLFAFALELIKDKSGWKPGVTAFRRLQQFVCRCSQIAILPLRVGDRANPFYTDAVIT
jgi:hypothetical protein